MQAEMLPVERPLLSKQLELLDDVLAQGIAPHKVSTQSSSFTSILGRVYRSGVVAEFRRRARETRWLGARRRRRDATHKSHVPAGLTGRCSTRRPDAIKKEEEEVQEEAFKLEEQQY